VTLDLNRKRHGTDQVRIFNSLDAAFATCQACARSVGVMLISHGMGEEVSVCNRRAGM
jgi:hypothetical protein